MAITVKTDIVGSVMTAGVSDARRDRGVRITFVDGLTNNNQKHKQALDAIIAAVGTGYHVTDGPPLDTVDIRTFGPTSAWATLRYARHGWSGFQISPFLNARITGRSLYRKWYRDTTEITDGVPDGPMTFWPNPNPQAGPPAPAIEDRFATPIAWAWHRVVAVIRVPFDLADDPFPTVAPKLGMANSDSVTFNGYSFAQGTVIFREIEEAVFVSPLPSSNRYRGWYLFEAESGGWFNQKVVFNEEADPPQWQTVNFTEWLETASFASGGFPG